MYIVMRCRALVQLDIYDEMPIGHPGDGGHLMRHKHNSCITSQFAHQIVELGLKMLIYIAQRLVHHQ